MQKRSIIKPAVFVCFLLSISTISLALPSHESPYGKPDVMADLGPGIKTGTLDNGMHYIIAGTRVSRGMEMRLVVGTGSMMETDEQRGISHLIEHLQCQRTARFTGREFVEFIESQGGADGQNLNAATFYNYTQFFFDVPFVTDANIETGLKILDDWAHGPVFTSAELDSEKDVVLEEIRMYKSRAEHRKNVTLSDTLFKDTIAYNRDPLGTSEHISGYTVEDVQRYVKKWYRPENMCMVLVGRIDPAVMEYRLKNTDFMPFPEGKKTEVPRFVFPSMDDSAHNFIDEELTDEEIVWNQFISVKNRNRYDATRIDCIGWIVSQALNQRFNRISYQDNVPFLYAGFDAYKFWSTNPVQKIQWTLKPVEGKGREAVTAYMTEIHRIYTHGITREEFEQGLESWNNNTILHAKNENNAGLRRRAEALAEAWLLGSYYPYTDQYYRTRDAVAEDITIDEVQEWIEKYIVPAPARMFISTSGRNSSALSNPDLLVSARDRALQDPVEPYEVPAEISLLPAEPSPGSIADEDELPGTSYKRWTLSNGIILYIEDIDNSSGVQLQGYSDTGLASLETDELPRGQYCTQAFKDNGAGKMTGNQMRTLLQDRIYLDFFTSSGESVISGGTESSDSGDLELMFKALYAHAVYPRRDAKAEELWRKRTVDELVESTHNPFMKFKRELGDILTGSSPRRRQLTAEEAAHIDMDLLFDTRQKLFGNLGEFTFILSGNFLESELRDAVGKWLASVPVESIPEKVTGDDGVRPLSGPVERYVYAGSEKQARVELLIHTEQAFSLPDYGTMLVLERVINNVMYDSLREKEDGTYTVASGISIDNSPYSHSLVEINFQCAPERQSELREVALEALDNIRKGHLADDEFNKAHAFAKRWVHPQVIAKRWVHPQAIYLSLSIVKMHTVLSAGAPPGDIQVINAAVNSADKTDITELAERILNIEEALEVVLLPENYNQMEK